MALKRKLTKDEFEKLGDAQKELYKEKDGSYLLDLDGSGDDEEGKVATLKASLDRAYKERDDLKKAAEKFKDIDPDKYKQLMSEAAQKDQESKKKSNDWEGWKATFEEGKTKEVDALKAELAQRDQRIRKFVLEDKIRAAAIESGVRKGSIDRVVRDVLHPDRPRFRLDDNERIEVLDETGNPMDVKVDSFFKDKFSTEAPEYYEPTGAGGSGAPSHTGGAGSGGKKTIKRADFDQLPPTARDSKIKEGFAVVDA